MLIVKPQKQVISVFPCDLSGLSLHALNQTFTIMLDRQPQSF
jgi:hypothetical protein